MNLISRIFYRFFWMTWESPGFWMLSSLLCFLLCIPIVLIPAALGGMIYCAALVEHDREALLRDFWHGFRYFGLRSSMIGLCIVLLLVITAANIMFYLNADILGGFHPLLRMALAGIFGWIGIFGFMIFVTAWTFMIYQDETIVKTLRRGMILTCAHPFISLNLFLTGLLVFLILSLTVIGIPLILPALVAILPVSFAGAVLEFYEEKEDRELKHKMQDKNIQSWVSLKELNEREARRRLRYQKGWRDILRPWEMQ
jgi:uncharacterized membrane protein YesL